jgi:hypothetical protein
VSGEATQNAPRFLARHSSLRSFDGLLLTARAWRGSIFLGILGTGEAVRDAEPHADVVSLGDRKLAGERGRNGLSELQPAIQFLLFTNIGAEREKEALLRERPTRNSGSGG